MVIREKRYTTDDFWEIVHLPENTDRRLELIDGEICEMTPSFVPSAVAIRLAYRLTDYVEKHEAGYVTGADGGYILSEYDTFIPDVGFITKARLPEIPAREVPVPPDLAVEVVSPTDSVKTVQRKAMRYLAFGTRMVWIVYPDEKTVDVCTPAASGGMIVQEIGLDGLLDGGDVLPGFSLRVRDIFPA